MAIVVGATHVSLACSERTLEFLRSNRELASTLPDLVDKLVGCMRDCCTSSSLTSSSVIKFMEEFERRSDSKMDAVRDQVRQSAVEVSDRMSLSMLSHQQHVTAAMVSIDSAVRASVERMSVESLSAALGAIVESHMLSGRQDLRERIVQELKPVSAMHEHALSLIHALPSQMASVMDRADVLKDVKARVEDLARQAGAHGHLHENLTAAIANVARGVDHMWSGFCASADKQSAGIPGAVKGVLYELMTDLNKDSAQSTLAVTGMQSQLGTVSGALMVLQKTADDLTARLDALQAQTLRQSTCNKAKGQVSEARLYELLSDQLTARDDFTIDLVTGQAHNCDLNIRRLGHTDVRLEAKSHGETTGEKVRQKEVARFRSDLLGMNAHGIFVSLHSGIVGKRLIDIEQLSNGKFAVYLSKNNYDIELIYDVLMLIYRIEKMCESSNSDAKDTIRISQEGVRKMQLHVKDFGHKISVLKTHLKESLSLLNDIAMEQIEQIVLGSAQTKGPTTPPESIGECSTNVCGVCDRSFKSRAGLATHAKTHANRA
jgi:hypothetical protein